MPPPPASRPRIRELRLRNFRSFADARLPLDDFTVLVGRNGAGKSNLLNAFDFLRDALRNGLRTAVERRGNFPAILHKKAANRIRDTDDRIEIGVEMELPALSLRVIYGFSLREDPNGFRVDREELQTYPKRSFSFSRQGDTFAAASLQEGVKPVTDTKGLLLPLLAGQEPVWETQVFDRAVRPAWQSGTLTAYFLVDSLRFEMGNDLALALEAKGTVTLEWAASVLPATTPCGMAALMPGADGTFKLTEKDGRLVPEIGGQALPDSGLAIYATSALACDIEART